MEYFYTEYIVKGVNILSKNIKIFLGLVLLAVLGAAFFGGTHRDVGEKTVFREVTDSTGTNVRIPVHPQRVIFLNVSNMDMYYAAGGKAIGKPTSQSMDDDLQAASKDVPEVGMIHNPNIETILSLNPDLVIGVNVPFHTNIRETLQQAGIPLYINKLDTYEDVLSTLDFFGSLTGNTEMATSAKTRIEDSYNQVVSKVKGKTPPRSLIIFGAPGSLNMATRKSFSGDLVEQLGGGNIADLDQTLDEAIVPLSMEYVTKQDPEVILFISMMPSPELVENFKAEMSKSSLWQGVDAVKKGRIYYLSGSLFSVNPGTKIGNSLEILYHDLYEPEVVK